MSSKTIYHEINKVKIEIMATLCGMFIFYITLAFIQLICKKFKVQAHHSNTNYLGYLFVFLSSFNSTITSILILQIEKPSLQIFTINHMLLFILLSFITFFIFGGRSKYLFPSSLLHEGAFVNEKLDQKDYSKRVTQKQKKLIQIYGYKYGCHSCGILYNKTILDLLKHYQQYRGKTLNRSAYFADHSPPQAIARKNQLNSGFLLPQCQSCSYQQSSCVKKSVHHGNWEATNSSHIITHITRLRLFKIWVPWPVLFYLLIKMNYL